MAARSKRSADERRLAILREIANEGANRNCLECHQRGPTYVDMTIGSFVCTKCCGLLRGLNPPHRTKSITMTSFSDEEIEFIKNRGNEFNRYVYLGTYDERSNLEKESLREEHKIKDFLLQKYERKRWYVDPEIAQHKMQLDRRQKSAAEQGISLTGGSVSMPSKPPASFATRSQPVTPAGGELWSPPTSNATSSSFSSDLFALCKDTIPPPVDPFKLSSASSSSSSSRFLFDPFQANSSVQQPTPAPPSQTFISPPPTTTVASVNANVHSPPKTLTNGGFADFDSAFGDAFAKKSSTAPVPSPVTLAPMTPLQPMQPSTTNSSKEEPEPTKQQNPQTDRYAALAELDELFSGQKVDALPKDTKGGAPTDPWGNVQVVSAAPVSNPFSPTGGPQPSNPWGSPATQQAISPNPFAMAKQSWGTASPVPAQQERITPTTAPAPVSMMGVAAGFAGIQLNGASGGAGGLVNGDWLSSNKHSSSAALTNGTSGLAGPNVFSGIGFSQPAPTTTNAFPANWASEQVTNPQNGTAKASGHNNDWATFNQQTWPNGGSSVANNGTSWGSSNGGPPVITAPSTEVWPQMPNSASTPAIAGRSESPALNATSKVFPQSISMHSPFASTNGNLVASSFANPFAANGATAPLAAARVCSTSNPFL